MPYDYERAKTNTLRASIWVGLIVAVHLIWQYVLIGLKLDGYYGSVEWWYIWAPTAGLVVLTLVGLAMSGAGWLVLQAEFYLQDRDESLWEEE